MRTAVAYRCVLMTLAVSLVSIAASLSFYSYASAQSPTPTVTFGVNPLNPTVPTSPPNRPRNGPITTIAVDPLNEYSVLVASENGGLFRSFDGALTWRHEDLVTSTNTLGVAYLRDNRIIVTAAAGFDALGGGVWIQGTPWSGWTNLARIYSLFPAPGPQCSATPGAADIAVAPDTGEIYIGTDCGVAIGSADAGTWRHVELPGAPVIYSITALGGGHLIVGGPRGIWYSRDNGSNWLRETTGIGQILFIHGLSRDPRGGDRAYAVNERRQLYESNNGGESWSQIAVSAERYDCGGIAFAKAVQQQAQVQLYFGDRCHTRVTSFSTASEPVDSTPIWSLLIARHEDTRDIVFHLGTARPYLMSSDGGLESTTDGTNFDWITRPWLGLEANEVTEVTGQYVGTSSSLDMYFATWHNGVYAVGESRNAGLCPEGWGFGLLRRAPVLAAIIVSVGCMGVNRISDALFQNVTGWSETAQRLPPPVILAQGTYVQENATTGRPGLQYTTNTGASWRHIVDIRELLRDRPKVAGPEADPTVIQAIQSDTTASGQQVVGLVTVSGFSHGGTAVKRNALMSGFGTIGVMPTQVWYEVYAVDPNDPAHIIAADGFSNAVQVSSDGGDNWHEIPNLTDLVSHHGAYRMGQPVGDRVATLVSSISFCPDNPSRVLIGTHEGGAYFSFDSGQTWTPVTGSEGIVNATSFFWLNNCGSVWASSYGRGLWKITMTLTSPLSWTELLCNHCPLDAFDRELLLTEHPDPKLIQVLAVLDGQINAIDQSSKTTIVTVSPGSVLLTYGDLQNLKVVFEQDTALPEPAQLQQSVQQGIIVINTQMSVISGASQLELHTTKPGIIGLGMEETPASQKPSIEVVSPNWAFGTPAVMSGEPLIVHVKNMESVLKTEPVLQIDGTVVAKVNTSQEVFEYVDKFTQWSMGQHVVALVTLGPQGPQTVWVTDFLVPHEENEEAASAPVYLPLLWR